jgi:hypothetical protein
MEVTARHPMRRATLLISGGLTGISLLVSTFELLAEKYDAALGVFVVGVVPWSVIGTLLVLSMSEIVVNDSGLSRRLWGKTLATIRWDNIRLIRTFEMFHPALRRKVRFVNVFPTKPSGFRLLPSGMFSFGEDYDSFDDVVRCLRGRVAAQGIPVETRDSPTSWIPGSPADLMPRPSSADGTPHLRHEERDRPGRG